MKREPSIIQLSILLPQNYNQKIYDIMDDEFKIASKKWDVYLNSDDKDIIKENTLIQLERKVEYISKNKWNIHDNIIKINIKNTIKGIISIQLPINNETNNEILNKHYSFVRVSNEWVINDDDNSDAIELENFYQTFMNDMEKWIRTAVFYGVGSFS